MACMGRASTVHKFKHKFFCKKIFNFNQDTLIVIFFCENLINWNLSKPLKPFKSDIFLSNVKIGVEHFKYKN
jgi:hypothetical protein